jgi:hypothetical protein
VMPTYQGILTAPETAAIVELIKSLREGEEQPAVQLPAIADGGVIAVDGWIAPAPSDPAAVIDDAARE